MIRIHIIHARDRQVNKRRLQLIKTLKDDDIDAFHNLENIDDLLGIRQFGVPRRRRCANNIPKLDVNTRNMHMAIKYKASNIFTDAFTRGGKCNYHLLMQCLKSKISDDFWIKLLVSVPLSDQHKKTLVKRCVCASRWNLVEFLYVMFPDVPLNDKILACCPMMHLTNIVNVDTLSTCQVIKLMTNPNIDLREFFPYHDLLVRMVGIIRDDKYKKQLDDIYNNRSADDQRIMEKYGYTLKKSLLDSASKTQNYRLVLQLLNKGYCVNKKQLFQLFGLNANVIFRNTIEKRRRRRRYMYKRKQKATSMSYNDAAKKSRKLSAHMANITTIVTQLINNPKTKKLLTSTFPTISKFLIMGGHLDLYTQLNTHLEMNIKQPSNVIVEYVKWSIKHGSVDDIHQLYNHNIARPIEISRESILLDKTIMNKKEEFFNYFSNELKMCCSTKLVDKYFRLRRSHKYGHSVYLHLMHAGYNVISLIEYMCRYESSETLTKVYDAHPDKAKFRNHCNLAHLMLNNHQKFIDVLIRDGFDVKKGHLINQIVAALHGHYWHYRSKANEYSAINTIIENAKKINGKVSCDIFTSLLKRNNWKMIRMIVSQCGIKPTRTQMLKRLKTIWCGSIPTNEFKYFTNKLKIDIYGKMTMKQKEEFLQEQFASGNWVNYINHVKQWNMPITDEHVTAYFKSTSRREIKVIKEFIDRATRDHFIISLIQGNKLSKSLRKRYGWTITIQEMHAIIQVTRQHMNNTWSLYGTINNCIYCLEPGVGVSPHTLRIIVQDHEIVVSFWIRKFLKKFRQLPQDVFDIVGHFHYVNGEMNRQRKRLKLPQIVPYEATPEEIASPELLQAIEQIFNGEQAVIAPEPVEIVVA